MQCLPKLSTSILVLVFMLQYKYYNLLLITIRLKMNSKPQVSTIDLKHFYDD